MSSLINIRRNHVTTPSLLLPKLVVFLGCMSRQMKLTSGDGQAELAEMTYLARSGLIY